MPQKQTNQLPAGGAVQDTDVLPADRVASPWTTVKLTALALYTYVLAKLNTAGRLIPAGGTAGQALTKTSATDYAVSWQPVPPPLPTTTIPGYVLTQQSTVPGDIDWLAVGEGLPAYSSPGDDGKVVTLVAGIPAWVAPTSGTTYRQTLSAVRRT